MTVAVASKGLRGLNPAYFSVVMATGIVSIGLQLQGYSLFSSFLMIFAIAAFGILLVLMVVRLVRHRDALAADLYAPQRAFGFFTLIAGANVVGVRLALEGWFHVTFGLLVFAGALWLVLGYLIPWTAVLGRHERPIIAAANGTWFIWVVAAQSVAVSAATLQPAFPRWQSWFAVTAVVNWSIGVILYAAAGLFVGARMLQYDLGPRDLTPPYWVAMGAAAISVLSGARIVEMVDTPMVAAVRGLIAGSSVVLWGFATWLMPALLAVGWWRHIIHRVPLRYEPDLWGIVFPLGMYSVAGTYLGAADRLPLVGAIGQLELWVAVGAWMATFGAMIVHFAARAWAVGDAPEDGDIPTGHTHDTTHPNEPGDR